MRIIFMGTPEFAVGTLQALVDGGYDVVAVVTQPDKPVGRHGSVLQPPPVKVFAQEHGIPVLQPEKMKDPAFIEELRSYNADVQVVVAFRMLPEVVWSMPRWGTFNVHAALLPQYRGAAPINWAIINGETETGVTTFFLDHDIDTGRIIMQKPFAIPDDADVEYVYDGLMKLGAEAAVETLKMLQESGGDIPSMPQEELIADSTELHNAPKIFKETCKIDLQQPCKRVYDFIRGLSPIPGAWGSVIMPGGTNAELKIYRSAKTDIPTPPEISVGQLIAEKKHCYVACQDTLLELLTIQPAGKKRMAAQDYLNGIHNA
ncbi:MAG: methionyl-tRNA formyltransferase [Prevotella sp.]|nr:methionyl-tRNA formyltransferase [Prevotella sp.]